MFRSRRSRPAWLRAARAFVLVAALGLCVAATGGAHVFLAEPSGDSGWAPDLGARDAWVVADGSSRILTVSTLIGRADLAADEDVYWHLSTAPGGDPRYGAEYVVQLDGNDGAPDFWRTYAWDGVQFQSFAIDGFALVEYAQEIRWTARFIVTLPNGDDQVEISMRTESVRPLNGQPQQDTAPDAGFGSDRIVLNAGRPGTCAASSCAQPGAGDILTGQGGQTEVRTGPPPAPPPPPECRAARNNLRVVSGKLKAAVQRRNRARRAVVRRRHAKAVIRLTRQKKQYSAQVRAYC
jgi:hypothetical protein